jgi:hypothetical protein
MLSFRVISMNLEEDVRNGMLLALGGLVLLAGCDMGDKTANVPVKPKWQGATYHLAFDTQGVKPNPAGVTIPMIKYIANPADAVNRITLVVRFDAAELTKTKKDDDGPVMNKMIMAPVDIKGAEGSLPADYMDYADKGLAQFLGAYCFKGKINISVALARSSLTNRAADTEVDNKRLSDWLPTQVVFKNPHPKC